MVVHLPCLTTASDMESPAWAQGLEVWLQEPTASLRIELPRVPDRTQGTVALSGHFFEDHEMGFFRDPIPDAVLGRWQQLNQMLWDSRVVSLYFGYPDSGFCNSSGWNFAEKTEMVWVVFM